MGTVARLLDEHVSFRCTSVDRIAVRGYIPGLLYEGGMVKFPAQSSRRHHFLSRPQSKEEIARRYQDEAAIAGRPGLVLVGKAQERARP
jgi:hypothetical protein